MSSVKFEAKTMRGKTRDDKRRQEKTREDKRRQEKTREDMRQDHEQKCIVNQYTPVTEISSEKEHLSNNISSFKLRTVHK